MLRSEICLKNLSPENIPKSIDLIPAGCIKIKIVERTGDKIVDLLHRSNAWADSDCERSDCIVCDSAENDAKKGSCKIRGVTYEVYCKNCEKEKESVASSEKEKET